jgi:hypothetical protein
MDKKYSMKGAIFKNRDTALQLANLANWLGVSNKQTLKFCIYYSHGFETYKCVVNGIDCVEAVTRVLVPFSVIKTEFESSQLSVMETWLHENHMTFSELAEVSIQHVSDDWKSGKIKFNTKLYKFFPHLK